MFCPILPDSLVIVFARGQEKTFDNKLYANKNAFAALCCIRFHNNVPICSKLILHWLQVKKNLKRNGIVGILVALEDIHSGEKKEMMKIKR